MSESKVVARYVPARVDLIGTDADLTRALRRQAEIGLLLSTPESLRPDRLPDGRWHLAIRVARPMTPAEVRAAWWKRHGWSVKIAVAVLVSAAALFGIGLALVTVVGAAVDAVDGSLFLPLAIGAFVLWLILSAKRGHPCRGLHCSGCSGKH
jgi:hypothetical protein